MIRVIFSVFFLLNVIFLSIGGDFGLTYATDTKNTDNIKNLVEKLKKFNPVKEKDLRDAYDTIYFSCVELMKKGKLEQSDLLDEVILLYNRAAKVHLVHNVYEYIMPYYEKYPEVVKKAVKRLLSKNDAEEFFSRLEMIIREHKVGNG